MFWKERLDYHHFFLVTGDRIFGTLKRTSRNASAVCVSLSLMYWARI
jgi:hypothetical protein